MLQKSHKILNQSTIVITGGTGSFGQTMLRRLLSTNVNEIRILSRDETKQDQLRRSILDDRVKFYIGDVRDLPSLAAAFRGADFCFHAAALKHVPSSEFFPMEALKTNVIGTRNVLEIARESRLSKVILLSTDKAVSPINAMGMTKGLMERVGISFSREQDEFPKLCITRYGNVIASRGSVLPHFINQARMQKKLTITNPNMTRFVMSLDEAVNLVLHAFTNGGNGELFVQKSPAATVRDIAGAVNRIFQLNEDNVRLIGIRHGEKMYETLLNAEERRKAVEEENFYRVSPDTRKLDYDSFIESGCGSELESQEYNSNNTRMLNVAELEEMLLANYETRGLIGEV